jgi:adenylosuccinate lyase
VHINPTLTLGMMMQTPLEKLRELYEKEQSYRKVGKILGFSATYINWILDEKYPITEAVAKSLGFDLVESRQWVERK